MKEEVKKVNVPVVLVPLVPWGLTDTNSSANDPYYDYLNDWGLKLSPSAATYRAEEEDIGHSYTTLFFVLLAPTFL